uniref:Uncharacterized protein n=1 Tax=Anopheles melas TaxID=34690 RepID=A0A182TW56_9DIPT
MSAPRALTGAWRAYLCNWQQQRQRLLPLPARHSPLRPTSASSFVNAALTVSAAPLPSSSSSSQRNQRYIPGERFALPCIGYQLQLSRRNVKIVAQQQQQQQQQCGPQHRFCVTHEDGFRFSFGVSSHARWRRLVGLTLDGGAWSGSRSMEAAWCLMKNFEASPLPPADQPL